MVISRVGKLQEIEWVVFSSTSDNEVSVEVRDIIDLVYVFVWLYREWESYKR